MTEKVTGTNMGNLEIEVTIDDRKAYAKPWTIKLHQILIPRYWITTATTAKRIPRMRSGSRTASVLLALAAPLAAQWVSYPTAGVPRLPNGAPNLSAPTPRSADGHPGLSGLWGAEVNIPCPPDGCADLPLNRHFLDIGWRMQGGLPFQPWAAEAHARRSADNDKDAPSTRCLPYSVIQMHTTPLYRKIVQAPGMLAILNEHDAFHREIYTDGRPLPADPQPSWRGYSSGRWEGDTLVVQSIGFRDGQWLDMGGSPMTDAAKLTERFHRIDYGHLEIEITLDDPKAYTKPWSTTISQVIVLNTELLDYICAENEKDVVHLVGK
jgi:hypothetical protein